MPMPNGVKFNFKHVEKLYQLIQDDGRYLEVKDQVLEGGTFQQLVLITSDNLGVDETNTLALTQFLATYHGRMLSIDVLIELMWRCAAGQKRLCKNIPIQPEFIKTEKQWVPLRIEDVRYGPLSKLSKKQLAEVTFRVFDGPFAGLKFKQSISHKFLMYKLAREIGFPRYKACHKNELVLCWLAGLLELEDPMYPFVAEFASPSNILYHNKKLRKTRDEPCIRDYDWAARVKDGTPCRFCPAGHTMCENAFGPAAPCPRATQSTFLIKKPCPKCGIVGYFDQGKPSGICVTCIAQAARKHIRRGSLR